MTKTTILGNKHNEQTRDQAETYLLNTMVGCGKIVNKDWYSGYLRALAEVLDLIASYEDGTIDPIPEEYL